MPQRGVRTSLRSGAYRLKALRNHLWLVLVLALCALIWWLETSTPFDIKPRLPQSKPKAVRAYEVLQSCSLVEHRDNDGDSFLISHEGGTHTFRLYFVDAPEKRRHKFNGDRLRRQAEYFGELTEEQVIQVGLQARALTTALLREKPLTIHTRWREVYDSGRYYAFVEFADGEDLIEKLVQAGLVRIHTQGAPHPDGRSETKYRAHLQQLEKDARNSRRGGWGRE